MSTLGELRDALSALGLSTTTGTLRGEARRAELAKRLQHARAARGTSNETSEAVGAGIEELQRLSLSELRSALELRQVSTQTPGLKGEGRRHALIQRLLNAYSGEVDGKLKTNGMRNARGELTSRLGDFADDVDDTKSESSTSSYSNAEEFIFYDSLSTRTSGVPDPPHLKVMPQLSFSKLKAQCENPSKSSTFAKEAVETTEQLQRELFGLREKLHTSRREQQLEVEQSLKEAGIDDTLEQLSSKLQALERERRRLQQNYFAHELVTSELLPSGDNQHLPEFVQEDALLLLEKRQEALKQRVERTKEAMTVARFIPEEPFQVDTDRTASGRAEEQSLLQRIRQIEVCLTSQARQASRSEDCKSVARLTTAFPFHQSAKQQIGANTPVLSRCRSTPNGLLHDQWEEMDASERRQLHRDLRMAVSFRIQQDRVSLEIPACFGASSSDTTPRTPSPADKLGMKAQFMQKSKRNPAEIIEVYDKALELDGNHAANIGNYALFLCTTCSQMDQAELYFKRALDVDPANAKNLANYGNFLRCVRKDFPASEACYKRAMDAAPNDVGILGGYADLLAAKESGDAQNLEMARKLLEKALGIHPTHTRNRLRLAMVLSNLEDNEEADRCFKALLASVSQQKANDNQIKQETLVSIYGNYASFLFRRGQWARAKHLYDKAVKVDPQHPWLLRNFSCFLRESRQVLSPRGETTAL